MDIRLKAALYTVGWLAAIFAGVFVVSALAHFFGTDATLIFAGLLGVFLIWTMYGLMLSRLKMDESIQESMDNIRERLKKY
jgi:uncharacterized membrane protein required for colicin V production